MRLDELGREVDEQGKPIERRSAAPVLKVRHSCAQIYLCPTEKVCHMALFFSGQGWYFRKLAKGNALGCAGKSENRASERGA